MNLFDLHEHYWLSDGIIKSFHLDIENNSAEIQLSVRRIAKGKKNEEVTLADPCVLKLTFHDLIEASLFDKFPTGGYYLQCALYGENDKEVGISFNLHDNSSETYEKPNWVIKAQRMSWKEV